MLPDTLTAYHPNLFHSIPAPELRAAIAALSERVPSLSHHEIVVELARIIASIHDGHTRLTLPFDPATGFFTGHSSTPPPAIPGLVFRHYPIRLGLFSDGLFVTSAAPAQRALLGGRVIRLGDLPVDAAMTAVEPTIQRDNGQQVRHLLPTWLVVPEILHARGVVADMERLSLEVETASGSRREGRLAPVPPGTTVHWLSARAPGTPPRVDQHAERRFWFESLPGRRSVYARYREVLDDESETVAAFAARLFACVDAESTETLVLDIRGNVGGNNFLNLPLLHGIIRAERLWQPGGLFLLVDRGTFSAAMMLAADLEKHTPALLVGEAIGAKPNGYGDSRRLLLPNTGLTVRVSTLYWQMTGPGDERDAIVPHWGITTPFAAWQANHDPVIDTILALDGEAGVPQGAWAGCLGLRSEREEIRLRFADSATGSSGRFDFPRAELVDYDLQGVACTAGVWRFTWIAEDAVWRFRARPAADLMLGVVTFKGSTLPFFLRREPPGTR